MTDPDWDDLRDDGIQTRTCDRCGSELKCRFTVDAYTEELYPEDAPTEWLCYDCYMENADDV